MVPSIVSHVESNFSPPVTLWDLRLVVLRVYVIFRDLADKSLIKRVRPEHGGPLGVNRDVTGWVLENSLNLVDCILHGLFIGISTMIQVQWPSKNSSHLEFPM